MRLMLHCQAVLVTPSEVATYASDDHSPSHSMMRTITWSDESAKYLQTGRCVCTVKGAKFSQGKFCDFPIAGQWRSHIGGHI